MKIIEFLSEIERHHIIGIVGALGDGKTILGVSTVCLFKIINQYLNNDRTILTNIPITLKHELLTHYDQLDDRHKTLIFIDEIHQNADSRTWHGKGNFFTTGITMDVRKFQNKLFWTSQYANQVEKRIRQLTTLYIKPRQIEDLIFEIFLSQVDYGNDFDHLKMNLDPFKEVYDTHYKPIPLQIEREK